MKTKNKQVASGSGADDEVVTWAYYDQLSFLDGTLEPRKGYAFYNTSQHSFLYVLQPCFVAHHHAAATSSLAGGPFRLRRRRRGVAQQQHEGGAASCGRAYSQEGQAGEAFAVRVVLAICALHNYVIDESAGEAPATMADTGLGNDDNGRWRQQGAPLMPLANRATGNRPTQAAVNMRRLLVDFFNGPGAVEWQDEYA